MGSPELAVPPLHALADRYEVVGVVTQPDRPAGRGRFLRPPPIKVVAQELGLPVIQPARLTDPAAMGQLRDWRPDLIVVVAFGQILRPQVLNLPSLGCLNVHASLLPRWRGASPIQAAISHGDAETGVTLMKMDEGLDTGPILSQSRTRVGDTETGGGLAARLATMGAELLIATLPQYLAGGLMPVPQDQSLATYAGVLKKSDGALDFSRPAEALARQVRAYEPWPGSYILWREQRLLVRAAHAVGDQPEEEIGAVRIVGKLPAISTSRGFLVLDSVQPAGKPAMSGEAFLRGSASFAEASLGSGESRSATPVSAH